MTAEDSWREVRPAPSKRDPGTRTLLRTAALATGVVVLAFGVASGPPVRVLVAVGAIVLVQLAILVPAVDDAVVRIERPLVAVVGGVLSWVLLLPVYFLVLTPASAVLRALGVRPLDHRVDRRGASLWLRRVAPQRPTSTHMFSDERGWGAVAPPRRVGRTVVRAVVAVLAVEAVVAGVVVLIVRRSEPEPVLVGSAGADPASTAALRNEPWIGEMMDEELEVSRGGVFAPFVGTTLRDYSGRYINVRSRVRRSYEPPVARGVEPIDIWFFGGSTMFGFDAQRDQHTIPSAFARLAEAAGVPVRVRNYGSPGFVNFQETTLLSILVSAGERPDLVVFYDGVNDFSLQLLNAVGGLNPLGEPSMLGAAQFRGALFDNGIAPGGSAAPPGPLTSTHGRPYSAEDVVTAVTSVYSQGMEVSDALAAWHGFEVLYFWQPSIYSRAALDPGERALLPRLGLDRFRFDVMSELERAVRERLPSGVTDLAGAMDDVEGPVYADNVHANEAGASAVAAALFSSARPTLDRLAG